MDRWKLTWIDRNVTIKNIKDVPWNADHVYCGMNFIDKSSKAKCPSKVDFRLFHVLDVLRRRWSAFWFGCSFEFWTPRHAQHVDMSYFLLWIFPKIRGLSTSMGSKYEAVAKNNFPPKRNLRHFRVFGEINRLKTRSCRKKQREKYDSIRGQHSWHSRSEYQPFGRTLVSSHAKWY